MKKIFLITVIVTIFITVFSNSGSQESYGWTNDKIRSMESEIANNRDERRKLQNTLSNVEKIKQNLTNARNDLARYIEELDSNLAVIEQNIVELLGLIVEKEDEIIEKTLELSYAIEVQNAQYAGMKERVKFNYEQGEVYYLTMLFGAESLSDMLNRVDYIEALSKYDEIKLDEFIATTNYVALCKEILEAEKEFLDEAKEAVEAEREALNQLIDEKGREIEAIRGDIALQEGAIREYEAEIAAQSDVIRALEKAVADERARLAEENRRRYDGGLFAWPVPSSRRISDDYGNRIHPILGVPQFHNGIDITAPTGSNIVAAYHGKVVAAAYSPTMGNYIIIDHGDSVFTLYMHASKLHVSEGAEVTWGQTIAAVGSTGRSTGPHLHFSVRVKGQYVSPWSYFGS
ncbi:MAG: peptidoglycan DD-metalloendopeptidase family protein [Lachnospiraceae bacterium]|nr:peptidoglycan DD-metalloendopeptidase family protein [Lachnospiraceae bacterium]